MPASFMVSRQGAWSSFTVVAQTTGDPAASAGTLRAAVRELDPDLAVYQIVPMHELVGASVARPRFSLALLLVFAGVAVAIAAVGVYGVIAYSVSQRIREMGIRMALGAESRAVRRLIVRQGMGLTMPGVVLGLLVAAWAARSLTAMLYGVPPHDPLTFLAVPLVLTLVALLACLVPALRAGAVDPVVALREE